MEVKLVLLTLFLLIIDTSEGLRNSSKSMRLNRVTEDSLKILVRTELAIVRFYI